MSNQYWQRVYRNIQKRLRRQFLRQFLVTQLALVMIGALPSIGIALETFWIGIAFLVAIVGMCLLSGFWLYFSYLGKDPLIIIGTITDMRVPTTRVLIDIHDAFYVDANGHCSDSKRHGRRQMDTSRRVYDNVAIGRPARLVCTPGGKAVYLLAEVEGLAY